MPKADAEGLNDRLAAIARAVTPDAHAVSILDRAGWHRSEDPAVPDDISLLKLPTRHPDLKPGEDVLRILHRNKLASAVMTPATPSRMLAAMRGMS